MSPSELFNLDGRVALVTGGSRGLGKQSALSLAKEGCKVSLCARNIDELENVVSDLRKNGYDALGIEADVTTVQGIETFYEKSVNAFGQVNIVVNNVGGTIGGRDFDTTTDEDWMNTINLNLMSAVRLTRLVLPEMKQRHWGRIVNITSGTVSLGSANYLHYITSKFAMIGMTRSMARELGPWNITVNTFWPGIIKTEIPRPSAPDKVFEMFRKQQCFSRLTTIDDLAKPMFFFAPRKKIL